MCVCVCVCVCVCEYGGEEGIGGDTVNNNNRWRRVERERERGGEFTTYPLILPSVVTTVIIAILHPISVAIELNYNSIYISNALPM